MKVSELIEHLNGLPQDLPVFVRYQDPLGEVDYWGIDSTDVVMGDVRDSITEKETPAVLVGDERV